MQAKQLRRLMMLALLPSFTAMGAVDGMNAGGQQGDTAKQSATPAKGTGKGGATGKATVPTTVFMLVPIEVASKDNAMKSGCWARIYSGTNYTGDTLTLSGPLAIADMSGPFGLNWDDKVDSVEIGPKATLTVFDNEQFRDQVAQFKPGQKIADISKPLGFFDEFASVRLSCAKP